MLRTGHPVLLDADAITVFAQHRRPCFQAIRGPCVLTPHDGEFARLFDPSGDKLTRARRAARESGALMVLKGADYGDRGARRQGRHQRQRAADSCDRRLGATLLGGMILGLLTQGMDAFAAAAAAVWMHGAAAEDFGPGLLAEDLAGFAAGVLRRLA